MDREKVTQKRFKESAWFGFNRSLNGLFTPDADTLIFGNTNRSLREQHLIGRRARQS